MSINEKRGSVLGFEIGEYAEGFPWELEINGERCTNYSGAPCKHALNYREEVDPGGIVGLPSLKYVTVPRLLNAYNEGRHNMTSLCLDCVLEAAK